MKGPNQRDPISRILHWAPVQATRMEKQAAVVLYVDEDRNPLRSTYNNKSIMDTIVVIGPGYNSQHGVGVEKAILLEIGRRRFHPYKKHYGERFGKHGGATTRHKYVDSLNGDELSCFFGALETLLCDAATDDLGKRKQNGSSLWRQEGKCFLPPSVYFSVSFQDQAMVASMLQSQLIRKRKPLAEDMRLRARWVDKWLRGYDLDYAPINEIREGMGKAKSGLSRVSQWYERRSNVLLPHYWSLVLRNLSGKPSEQLFLRLMDYWGVDRAIVEEWGDLLQQKGVPIFSENVWVSAVPMRYKGLSKKTHLRFNGHLLPKEYMKVDFTPVSFIKREEDPFVLGDSFVPSNRVFNDSSWVPF